MSLLSAAELKRIESKHAEGISSADTVQIFVQKGERFSEATLRKYVQLGLLPKSRRVGARGRHRGSSGRYPVAIVRIINDIKRALEQGATLEEIRLSRVGLVGEVESLQRQAVQVMKHFEEAVARQDDRAKRGTLKKSLDEHRRRLAKEVKELGKLAVKLGNAT